jgi:creatinine amidohydrolase/Fe(II)-dependent formamide hydrolase-like protein
VRKVGVQWLFAAVLWLPAAAFAQASLFIEDLTWPELRGAIAKGSTTALYYAGSTEENGPHMVLGKHNFIARHVAGRIAQALGNALVYPTLPFAPTSAPLTNFPGTVNVSDATFAAVAREVALSALAAGFRDVVLMGDHGGGQDALKKVAAELRARRVHYAGDVYFKSAELVRKHLEAQGLPRGEHASIEDTSELMFLDPDRRWIRRDRLQDANAGTGVRGDPRQASAELGKLFIEFKVRAAVAQIRTLVSR